MERDSLHDSHDSLRPGEGPGALQSSKMEGATDVTRTFNAAQAARVAALGIKEKRRLLQVTRYGEGTPVKGGSFAGGVRHLNVFFPAEGLFGAEVLCHHIVKSK